jgi:beta-mannosidase
MMHTTISLNGNDWLFKDYVGEDWIWRNGEKPDTNDKRWWRQGTVPGSVHHDLLRLKEIPDPYFERNSLLVEWVPERTWIYKKTFSLDKAHQGKRIQLCFKGIDYEAQIFLNGKKIGEHQGMFTAASFDIENQILFGEENLLSIVIERAPDEEPQVSKTRYVHTHKSRMTYWWDFCPRMIHIGIWDDVFLKITGSTRIKDVFVQPHLNDDHTAARISVSTCIEAGCKLSVELEVAISYEGKVLARQRTTHVVSLDQTNMNSCLTIEKPNLWWPNGLGDTHLYEAKVTVTEITPNISSPASDEAIVDFGIRHIKWVHNETEDSTAFPYTIKVNGEKVYIKGWNWVPMDAMYGREQPEKLVRLLTLAKHANVNMLRVWGGGLIEKDAFYKLCNRFGLMVWQEFIQSSSGIENKPSEDPEFIEMMVKEAEQIIPGKRNHPSLVIWGGGNELQDHDGQPLGNSEPVLGALAEVVKRLDPDRYWLPTSPTGRCFSNNLENIEQDPTGLHDVHGPWEHQGLTAHYTLYNRGTSLLHSEFGVEGMTNLKVLNKTIAKENQWPAGKDNPVYFHRGSWWNNETLVQEAFGGIQEVGKLIQASQFLQSEGLRYAVESNLRRQYQNSGTLPWQFNEPFPNAYCTSALDYYAEPKPVYYAIKRAYQKIHVTACFAAQAWEGYQNFEAEVWSVNATAHRIEKAEAIMRLVGASGKVYWKQSITAEVSANGSTRLTEIRIPTADVQENLFFLDLSLTAGNGASISNNRYMFSRTSNLRPMLEAQPSNLNREVHKSGDEWELKVTNAGEYAALCVRLDDGREVDATGYVYFDDNYFSLMPGESQTIQAQWSGVAESERRIELGGWNISSSSID